MRSQELRDEDLKRLRAARWLPPVGPFTAFGRAWSVQTDDPALRDLISDLYADLEDAEPSPRPTAIFHVLAIREAAPALIVRDGFRVGGGRTPAAAMGKLVWGINRWVLTEASQNRLLLHAGGVVRDDGLAVILPAPSESGKSTLTTGLLLRGLGYLSDEAVELKPEGVVRGYAKPVSIDQGSWDLLRDVQPDPEGVGAAYLLRQWHVRASRISRTVRDGRLAAVVFPRYERNAETRLRQLRPSQALLLAARSTFTATEPQTLDVSRLRALAAAMMNIPSFELVVSDLAIACDLVATELEILDGPAARQLV